MILPTTRARCGRPPIRAFVAGIGLLAAGHVVAQSDDGQRGMPGDLAAGEVVVVPELPGDSAADEVAAVPGLPGGAADRLLDLPDMPERLREDAAGDASAELPVSRLEALLEVNRLSDDGRQAEALPLVERLIELTEQEYGARSIETAGVYETAARVQREAGQHELAERNYLHAVELYRSLDGTYTEQAIEPLIGLGDTYQASGQHLNAITAYNEARTVNRRVFGLLNDGQVPILDRITESFEELDQYAEADEQQRTILHLAERNYPPGSLEHLEAIYRYGLWLRERGRFSEERIRYAEAMRVIRNTHGKEHPLMVRPMRETANSYRIQRLPDNQGLSALRSALELLDEQDAVDTLARAEVLRDLGDWDVAFGKVEADLDAYRDAWTLLGEVENGDALREEWFQGLTTVLSEPISQRGLSRDPAAVPGYVIVVFDVDRHGRASNVRVASSEPAGFKDDAVVRAVRRWRFRPGIEGSEIVAREGVALRVNFRYLHDEAAAGAQ